jgi:hypothetical protein
MPNKDAVGVIRELRRFRDDIDQIVNAIGDKTWIAGEEKERLQALFKSLKSRLKEAAKRTPSNEFESAYFEPAVTQAAANLLIATNSHPIKSNWHSALYGIRIDITFYLHQLEQQFSDA